MLVEGAPPALDAGALLAFVYVSVVATALAFVAWFAGLRHLPAGTVGLLGLLNPVTGVLLGTLVAAEPLTARQLVGLGLLLAGVLAGQPAVIHRVGALLRRGGQLAATGRGAGLSLSGDRGQRPSRRMGTCGTPSQSKFGPAVLEPEAAVEVGQVGLGVEHDGLVADLAERGLEQPDPEAAAAGRRGDAQPPDVVGPVGFLEQPQAAEHRLALAVGAEPVVPGPVLQVTPVQLGVRAGLLDDEDVDPQPEQLVEHAGRPGPPPRPGARWPSSPRWSWALPTRRGSAAGECCAVQSTAQHSRVSLPRCAITTWSSSAPAPATRSSTSGSTISTSPSSSTASSAAPA